VLISLLTFFSPPPLFNFKKEIFVIGKCFILGVRLVVFLQFCLEIIFLLIGKKRTFDWILKNN
jgi:hypothetical protein